MHRRGIVSCPVDVEQRGGTERCGQDRADGKVRHYARVCPGGACGQRRDGRPIGVHCGGRAAWAETCSGESPDGCAGDRFDRAAGGQLSLLEQTDSPLQNGMRTETINPWLYGWKCVTAICSPAAIVRARWP